jgi:hypothetical protein
MVVGERNNHFEENIWESMHEHSFTFQHHPKVVFRLSSCLAEIMVCCALSDVIFLYELRSLPFSFLVPLLGVVFCLEFSPSFFFFSCSLAGCFFLCLFISMSSEARFHQIPESVEIFCLHGSSGWTFFFEIFIHLVVWWGEFFQPRSSSWGPICVPSLRWGHIVPKINNR